MQCERVRGRVRCRVRVKEREVGRVKRKRWIV